MGLVSDAGYKELRINGVSVSSSNTNTVFLGGETINLPGPDGIAPQFVVGGSNAKSGVGFYGDLNVQHHDLKTTPVETVFRTHDVIFGLGILSCIG
jgi:hypothetical protein